MKQIDPERLQGILNEHETEVMLLKVLVTALLDAHPNRQKVVEAFQREAQGFVRSAPAGTSQEFLVELRARLQINIAALNSPYKPIV